MPIIRFGCSGSYDYRGVVMCVVWKVSGTGVTVLAGVNISVLAVVTIVLEF